MTTRQTWQWESVAGRAVSSVFARESQQQNQRHLGKDITINTVDVQPPSHTQYSSLAMKPPEFTHPVFFFCTMPLGLAFKIGCQQDVFWIWWSYPPASYNSPGPGNATCWPSGNQQQNHLKPPGDRWIHFLHVSKQHSTYYEVLELS